MGTLYDYFPNKETLLSGYVRHFMDALLNAIEVQVIQPADMAWDERLRRLVRLTGALGAPDLPYFDMAMPDIVRILFASVWGAKRYLFLLEMEESLQRRWNEKTTQSCLAQLQQVTAKGTPK